MIHKQRKKKKNNNIFDISFIICLSDTHTCTHTHTYIYIYIYIYIRKKVVYIEGFVEKETRSTTTTIQGPHSGTGTYSSNQPSHSLYYFSGASTFTENIHK
ncbi:hypothetical protein, unlikely [Trypanosoma brucei gambiense DAL972]|uniref:Uncharacterized protein n=1 Tax=Trypanosoma brucei gambiense (strain MHOM/CI/86/DAL972) TaxID=679716 RepID=C9ZWC3_TRYB9|nr:hypothetical protein, unlikely [Trypanosoma brucei gambiense DAL972]CBH13712.1 hypothetical protein, unlikely [Trypanosoma brucei gambiense DAL972]|eukprot:XP_011775988.1 hypothetical protein, unlikely [Trypanosoma brucei gambiense DAL972]